LIAGGAGFIGSTVASACLDHGPTPVIVDNLSTGQAPFVKDRIFYRGDIGDSRLIARIFAEHPDIEAVVHCAGLVVVPDSVAHPLRYYRENVAKSVEFIGSVIDNGCGRLLFSSSASVYEPARDFAVDESSPLAPASPYAHSKAMVEQVLHDCSKAYPLRVVSLRYFNPIGADPAMRTGLPAARPTHVLGRMIQAVQTGEALLHHGERLADAGRVRDPGLRARVGPRPGARAGPGQVRHDPAARRPGAAPGRQPRYRPRDHRAGTRHRRPSGRPAPAGHPDPAEAARRLRRQFHPRLALA
jgi:nucleoside-diphosphate-sugar epimerase